MSTPNARYTVIRGGRILDIRRHRADRSDILVDGDIILEIGHPDMAVPAGAAELDASDRLLIPGLINAHTHGHGSLGKGMGDRWSLELLLNAAPWLSGNRTLEDKYIAAKLNAAELVRKGCTAAYDLYFELPLPTVEGLDAAARAYMDVGVRAVIAPMMADRTLFEAIPGLADALNFSRTQRAAPRPTSGDNSLSVCRALLSDWTYDLDRVRLALAPTIPLHCTDEFILGCRDLAREHGVGLHMHLAESKVQAVSAMRRYGRSLTAHLMELDFPGTNFTAAHCVWLDDDDIARLADRGSSIAHNPGSNLRLGSGIAPARAMLERGLNVGIGTDGSNCGDHQNMFDAMRMAAFVSRIVSPDYRTWLETADVIEMATEGSAAALGFAGKLGRIAPGYKADLVFLDLGSVNFVPFNDPVNQIVMSEDSSSVRSVMIGGKTVLDEGRFTTFDFDRLREQVEATVMRLFEVGAEDRRTADALAEAVGLHCVGLASEPHHVRRTCVEE